MKVLKTLVVLFTVGLLMGPLNAGAVIKHSVSEGDVFFSNDAIGLRFESAMNCRVSFMRGSSELSMNDYSVGGKFSKPLFFMKLNGTEVIKYTVKSSNFEDIDAESGKGKKLTLDCEAEGPGGSKIECRLFVEMYDKYPNLAVTYASFKNKGDSDLNIDGVYSNYLRLDRSMVLSGSKPYNFHSFQGAAYGWGKDYTDIKLKKKFSQKNFMGIYDRTDPEGEGGGIPLVDVWGREMGIAIAHIETKPKFVSLPVKVQSDNKVDICVLEEPDGDLKQQTVLSAGGSYNTLKTAIIVHSLDYYEPLSVYGNLLRDRGLKIKTESPDRCYEPYWKSWGFGSDFTLEQIYDVLPELKELGINIANLDDRWFDKYGDWNPRNIPGQYPNGESDMIAFVKRLHDEGFITGIWWYPNGVDIDSKLAKEHPDWLVTGKDGKPIKEERGLYYLCPAIPETREYMKELVEKFMVKWGFDTLYLDCISQNACPPCFNPAHNHKSPLDSFEQLPEFYKVIYDAAYSHNPNTFVELCACAVPHSPYKMPYYDIANASDPTNTKQVRKKIKVEKALRSPTFCYGDGYILPKDEREFMDELYSQVDFPTSLGAGCQLTTFYKDLDKKQMVKWKKWFKKHKQLMLSKGEYLNLYDIVYDIPEAHVVKKDGKYYYAFYARKWNGTIELRGLGKGKYRVYDYINDEDICTLNGNNPNMCVKFKGFLLVEIRPK